MKRLTGRLRPLSRVAAVATLVGGLLLVPGTAYAAAIDDAISAGAANAASQGITSYISVVDRQTGNVVGETGNAHQQVGSESIMKLFIAGYYAVAAGGSDQLTSARRSQLEYMIKYSDDSTASALFRADIIPSQAARYSLTETANATSPGHWGAARITAHDMAQYLYRMSIDQQVGPWLIGVMAEVAPNGSDGFDQNFGFNALDGVHGSKQGWGSDNFSASQPNAIHSVGYTDQWFAAVLQTGGSGTYNAMRSTATYTAKLIQGASRQSPDNPVGSLDSGQLNAVSFQLSGWALDPNDPGASIAVDVYDNGPLGLVGSRFTADGARPDVNGALGVAGNHGYSATLQLSGGGTHHICAYAINAGAGDGNTVLGCRVVTLGSDPVGTVDAVSLDGIDLSVSGWAFDPDQPQQPLAVHVYDFRDDGTSSGYPLTSVSEARGDVSAAYPGVGGNQGFSETIRLAGTGGRQICVFAINVGTGSNSLLGCRRLDVPAPIGMLDAVSNPAAGVLLVQGWSLDPTSPMTALVNHVYVTAPDGSVRGYAGVISNQSRLDVGAAYPGAGNFHGFSAAVPALVAGANRVCVYAINADPPGPNPQLGCQTINAQ